jgi:hypothetical protein
MLFSSIHDPGVKFVKRDFVKKTRLRHWSQVDAKDSVELNGSNFGRVEARTVTLWRLRSWVRIPRSSEGGFQNNHVMQRATLKTFSTLSERQSFLDDTFMPVPNLFLKSFSKQAFQSDRIFHTQVLYECSFYIFVWKPLEKFQISKTKSIVKFSQMCFKLDMNYYTSTILHMYIGTKRHAQVCWKKQLRSAPVLNCVKSEMFALS